MDDAVPQMLLSEQTQDENKAILACKQNFL